VLRRLDLKSQWRSLDSDFWPDNLPLGSRTVIYGHNGSGKSTLAELLLSLAEGSAATSVVWEDNDRGKTTVQPGGASPSPAMAVFTRKWVEANLSAFLDGENAVAIVTLGQAAIDSKETEKELEGEIGRLREEARKAEELHKSAEQKVNRLARQVQDRIVAELQRFDYGHYTKNRYSVVKVSELLRAPRTDFPDSGAYADALVRLGEGAPKAVPDIAGPPMNLADELEPLGSILERTPTRVALAALEADAGAQAWVERGLDLHEEQDRCLFCDGVLSAERREQLARHFDESWLEIRSTAQLLLAVVKRQENEMTTWLASLPDASLMISDLQAAYRQAVDEAKCEVEERLASR